MIRGTKQNKSSSTSGSGHVSLDSVEAGLHSSDRYQLAHKGKDLSGPLQTKKRSAISKAAKRRKSAKPFFPWLGPLGRAKLRRFLYQLKKNPTQLWLVLCILVLIAIALGFFIIIFVQYLIFTSHEENSSAIISRTNTTKEDSHSLFSLHRHSKMGSFKKPTKDQNRKQNILSNAGNLNILIHSIQSHDFNLPSQDNFGLNLDVEPDYGPLDIQFYEEDQAQRNILRDYGLLETPTIRNPDASADDDMDSYYFDDDRLRGIDTAYDSKDMIDESKYCRKISEHELNLPNCNNFHELDRLNPSTHIKYLNAGSYREVFSMIHSFKNESELFAIKDILYNHDFKYDDYEFVRMDAIVAERLTPSPRIYNIYGYCGLGIISEYFYHGDVEGDFSGGRDGYLMQNELHDEEELNPQNDLTGIEKVVVALEMAEALADLHGFPGGVIVHDDVQLAQFLFNKDKTRLILNDFNRAEFPLFDEKSGEYCRYRNGHGHGNWRAPEEYEDAPLNEKIDVWSLGNNIYALLTGLNPLYEIESQKEFVKRIKAGKTAYIDPRYRQRSPAENVLVDLLPKCFAYDPNERATIFEIVHELREAVLGLLNGDMTREDVLQKIETNS